MVESFLFVATKLIKKDFWMFFLTSLCIVLLIACRTELRSRFFKMVEQSLR